MKLIIAGVILCTLAAPILTRKVTEREIERVMLRQGFSKSEVGDWKCIIKHGSKFNTAAWYKRTEDGITVHRHGLFQIAQGSWCGPRDKGCGMTCDSLRDDDITNDVKCAMIIFKSNGFNGFKMYTDNCVDRVTNILTIIGAILGSAVPIIARFG